MYYIIAKNSNTELGTEFQANFVRYATMEELRAQTKRNGKSLEEMLEEGDVLSWIKLTNGSIAKGSVNSINFVDYATESEVKSTGEDLKKAHCYRPEDKEDKKKSSK